MAGMDKVKTCTEALAAWDNGDTITSVNISGMGEGYERGCQTLMFEAIRQHVTHEGDVDFWDEQVGGSSSEFFTDASQVAETQGMTGAMWGASISAAVVVLRNTWVGGLALAPADRIFEISKT